MAPPIRAPIIDHFIPLSNALVANFAGLPNTLQAKGFAINL
jgi:hypothetical protein